MATGMRLRASLIRVWKNRSAERSSGTFSVNNLTSTEPISSTGSSSTGSSGVPEVPSRKIRHAQS